MRRLGPAFLSFLLAACVQPARTAVPESSSPGATVAGRSWVAKIDEVADPQQRPRLEFVADGRVAGYSGCNMFGGKWTLSGAEVRLSALAMTKRACAGPGANVEKRFLEAVGEKSQLTLEGNRLVARGPAGATLEFVEETTPR